MSDFSLNIKLLNSIYRLASGRKSALPLYHGNDIPDYIESAVDTDVPRASVRKAPVSKSALGRFIETLSEDEAAGLAGIGVMLEGNIIAEHYNMPYDSRFRRAAFSLSKSVLSMAIGIAVADSDVRLRLDERLCDIFPAHDGIFFKAGMKDVTIKHLLTMTAGVEFDELSSYYTFDWRKAFMGSTLCCVPGTDFCYNSLNSYMLAAVICEKTGMSLTDYLNIHLFYPMGITDITWDKCPQGIEKGGWGLKLSMTDMLKLGQLYLNGGRWRVRGREVSLLDASWIEESLQCHVPLCGESVIKGYGYHIWLLKDGAYLFNGVFGQNIYVNPRRMLVIATTAAAREIFPGETLVKRLCDFAGDDRNFIREHQGPVSLIQELLRRKRKRKSGVEGQSYGELQELLGSYTDIVYRFDKRSACGIMPISGQLLYANYVGGIESLTIRLREGRMILHIGQGGKSFDIELGYTRENPFAYQVIEINGKHMPLAASGRVTRDGERKICIQVSFVYPEEIGSRIWRLYPSCDTISLFAFETPDFAEICGMLFGEKKLSRLRRFNGFSVPKQLSRRTEELFSPRTAGRADL